VIDDRRVEELADVERGLRGLRPPDVPEEGWKSDGGDQAYDEHDHHDLDEREARTRAASGPHGSRPPCVIASTPLGVGVTSSPAYPRTRILEIRMRVLTI